MSLALPIRRRILLPGPWARQALWKAAREVPSWHIAPARTGNVRDLVTGADLVTFSNSSPAWGFNSLGILVQATPNVPFVEYDPATGACLGWRVEEQRTNLVTWSQDFSQTDWSKNASTIVPTAIASPISGVNYQKIEASTANTTVGVTSIPVTAASQQRAVSFFAKPLGNITRVLVVVQGADARININLIDGTATTNATATGSTVTVSGERFTVSTPSLTNATGVRLFLKRTGESDTNTPTTIAIGEGLYLIGAQMEAGAFPTSYIPTTTATVTRSADVASILSWAAANNIRSAYIRGRTTASGTRGLLSGNDNSSSNRIEAITSGTDPRLQVTTSGSSVADIDGGTIAANTSFRMAMRFDTDSHALSVNGGAVVSDTSGARPTIDRWFLGRTQADGYGNCYLEELALFTSGLSDSRLTAMGGV